MGFPCRSSMLIAQPVPAAHGQEARNALQLQLLENREMADAVSGLKFLGALPYVAC
jgi:hypothetical protein